MKEIFLINAHCETTKKIDNLRNLIISIKDNGFDVCLITHTIIPTDIIDRCEYFIYDKENPLVNDIDIKYWTYYTTNEFSLYYKSDKGGQHHLAYYKLIFGGLNYLTSLNYDIVHSFDYDIIFNDFSEIYDNKKLLENCDIVYYVRDDNTPITYFSVNLNYVNLDDTLYDYKKLSDEYRIYFNEQKFPLIENLLFDKLPKNKITKNILCLENTCVWNTERMFGSAKYQCTLFVNDEYLNIFFLNKDIKLYHVEIITNVNLRIDDFNSGHYIQQLNKFSETKYIKVYIDNELFINYDFNNQHDIDMVTKWSKMNYLK